MPDGRWGGSWWDDGGDTSDGAWVARVNDWEAQLTKRPQGRGQRAKEERWVQFCGRLFEEHVNELEWVWGEPPEVGELRPWYMRNSMSKDGKICEKEIEVSEKSANYLQIWKKNPGKVGLIYVTWEGYPWKMAESCRHGRGLGRGGSWCSPKLLERLPTRLCVRHKGLSGVKAARQGLLLSALGSEDRRGSLLDTDLHSLIKLITVCSTSPAQALRMTKITTRHTIPESMVVENRNSSCPRY